ncbi:MAG: riboflavin kinase [Candidatus Daviesbacteria bacterium]|nr:riboflavin kinase [Candidatus Daviesbacteria bacterium]
MYKFWGKIKKHNQRGKKLGFPTANINLKKNIPEGIFISRTKIKNKFYPSLTFIGIAKTFNEKRFHAETYILDFDQDIYGKWISVKLLKKIRNNKKFNSTKELIVQIKKDTQEAKKYFSEIL